MGRKFPKARVRALTPEARDARAESARANLAVVQASHSFRALVCVGDRVRIVARPTSAPSPTGGDSFVVGLPMTVSVHHEGALASERKGLSRHEAYRLVLGLMDYASRTAEGFELSWSEP